ncbi:M42 family metallopeptidase [Thermomicrobium sp. 4228-Ro]|uniref:M42 family metallopeptidase n=1 Tax=Thermomicrobium sp. 4228-Ro TaxID=2993937 RepID=UPI0022493BB9|nr:M42 family metallopeptidase [Thermomicrobium sp. 4228-Ro]MCX2727663.1 M42 family metallopeptidase [Thermomicrobium sp. 4228-Ro]
MTNESASSRAGLAERLFELTRELADRDGVSGHEQAVVARLVELFRPFADRIDVDSFGNVFVRLATSVDRPVLMVTAHSDEIGLLVKGIEPNGFLRVEKIGGVIESLLPGRHVRVRGHRGVIGVRPGHLMTPEEQRSVPPVRELYVDLGFDSAEEVLALGIQVGDPIAFEEPVERLANPQRISGKALDNRVSCALLVALAERLRGAELGCQPVLVVTVQEEVGLRGAQMAAYRLVPDAAIVVDTVPAGGTPDTDLVRDLGIRIGGGPVLALASGMGGVRGHLAHPGMRDFLLRVAEERGIRVQRALFPRSTSDVAAVHLQRGGIPSMVVNIPRRYAHSPVETLDLDDVVATLELLEAAVRAFDATVSFDFLAGYR